MKFNNRFQNDDGYAVAEFAITLPALISVFAICLWSIGFGITKFQLESYTHSVARTLARGEQVSETAKENAPEKLQVNVSQNNGRIQVTTSVLKTLPILKKEIKLTSYAEAMSEIYEPTQ